jgi:hypothetical protein
MDTCIAQYSDVIKRDNEYYNGDFKINKDRVIKNISHLEKIKDHYKNDATIIDIVNKKIEYLKFLIE